MRYRAAVLHQVGAPLVIEQVQAEPLRPDDVLVRILASGLCHTDLEVMQGSLVYPLPIVLGHEGAGIVEQVGTAVSLVKPGDHVICSWNPSCGHCFYCDRDTPILCEPFTRHQPAGRMLDGGIRYRLIGATSGTFSGRPSGGPDNYALNGQADDDRPLHHFSVVSSHAEYSVVPQSGAIKVPDAMPFDRACLIGCGVMTGFGAVSRLARVEAGASVAVIGCGAVGLNAIQAAVLEQAARVFAIDRDPAKLARARVFGATDTLLADADTLASVREATAGRGVDYVFECAGGEAALQTMYDVLRPGGQAVILGKVNVDQKVSLRFGSMMGEKRVIRSSYGGARPRRDFPWLAQAYLDGKLKLDELISMRLPLESINDGFDAMRNGDIVRAVVTFEA